MLSIFHWHKWSHWEAMGKAEIKNPVTGGILGYIFIQRRTCHKCGLAEYKQDRIMADK